MKHKECRPNKEFLNFLDKKCGKRLTKGELDVISKRISEIDILYQDANLPEDILNSCDNELNQYINILETSIKINKRAHLRIIK